MKAAFHEPSHPERARSPGAARDQDRRGGTLRALGCGLSAASRDGSRSGSRSQGVAKSHAGSPWSDWSLITGDLPMLSRRVTPFSISSYQLPVTSYQSKRFMFPMRGEKPGWLSMNQASAVPLGGSPTGACESPALPFFESDLGKGASSFKIGS